MSIDTPRNAIVAVTPALPEVRSSGISLPLALGVGSTWGASIVTAAALGGTTPALVAFGTGIAASAVAYGKAQFFASNKSKYPLSAIAAHLEGSENQARDLRRALDPANAKTVRLSGAEAYVQEVSTLPGDVCATLLAHLPRGVNWGHKGRAKLAYHKVLTDLGFSSWSPNDFETSDLNIALLALSKLGPVTPAQRASLREDGVAIVSKFYGRTAYKAAFKGEVAAAVRELVARAPSA